MVPTSGLHHIHLIVRDMARALRFYQSVFGMREQFRAGDDMVFLSTPGSDDLITLNRDEAEREQAGRCGGVSHFGFKLAPGASLDAAPGERSRLPADA